MDMTLIVNGKDMHEKLSTYSVSREVTYTNVITTLDGTEHPYPGTTKTVVSFSLLPMTDAETAEVYAALSGLVFDATYTDQYTAADVSKRVRLVSNLDSAFALKSIDGKRRYKGGTIQLREL